MSSTIGSLLLQVVLILINAFFAASEIAVISLNEGKVRRQMENGDKKAGKLLRMVSEPTGFLSTIQVGITLAGFLGRCCRSFRVLRIQSCRFLHRGRSSCGFHLPRRTLPLRADSHRTGAERRL